LRNKSAPYNIGPFKVCIGESTPKERAKGTMSNRRRTGDDDKGLLWKLPQVRIRDIGKVGPAFGLGVGCGFGFGAGLIGGKFLISPNFDRRLANRSKLFIDSFGLRE